MRTLVLTLMMSFLSHSAFGAARVLASLEAEEGGGGAGAANAITNLVKLLKDSEPLVKQIAAGALQNLAVNADNQVTIAKAGAIPPLVELLKDPEVRETAAGALYFLALNADNRVRIKSEVSSHKDKGLIGLNLSSLAAENGWVQGLLNLINS